MKEARKYVPELPPSGIFDPLTFYKLGCLFSSQGMGTVNDISIIRASGEHDEHEQMSPVALVRLLPSKIVVFDGHHRTGIAILTHKKIPFLEISPNKANLKHTYPFRVFLKEMQRRMGRLEMLDM